MREATGVPVENGVTVTGIAPAGDLLAVTDSDGTLRHARKVVLATGQEGAGRWALPEATGRSAARASPAPTTRSISRASRANASR